MAAEGCARPGCGGVAAAWLSYDYARQRVWLDDPGADPAGHHSALCATHAARLRPPQGWTCQDRRSPGAPPPLFAPPTIAAVTVPPPEPPGVAAIAV